MLFIYKSLHYTHGKVQLSIWTKIFLKLIYKVVSRTVTKEKQCRNIISYQ